MNSLPKHSCPGEDGLSPLFFKWYWDTVKYKICEGFLDIVTTGILPQQLGEGLIFLIPKGGEQSDEIQKWRPITLLNTIYKLLAKTISLRLQPTLPQLLHVSQTGFIKERSILDNIVTFWELTALAKNIDFEKAYDNVDWDVLQGTMLRFGFKGSWIKGVIALYSTTTSRILIAG